MKKEMREQYLVIMHNGMAGEVECPICECAVDAPIGLAVFSIAPDSARLVCQRCAEKLDPALEEQFRRILSLEYLKTRVKVNLEEINARLRAVDVLGRIMEFNEKKDVSFVGSTIHDVTINIRKCLNDLYEATAEPSDEIPF